MKRVLIVEDDLAMRGMLSACLSRTDFTTCHAQNVDEALIILGGEPVDAITLDVNIPDPRGVHRNGLALLAYLRFTPEYRKIPVCLFTGTALSANDAASAERHHANVIYKPAPLSTIVDWLQQTLDLEINLDRRLGLART